MTQPFMLHLMRHGAPVLEGRLMGRTDVEPTPAGIAACVARAASLKVAAVISSDLKRAQAAAQAISAAHGFPHFVDARWRELDFGQWDGLAASEIEAAALHAFHADPDANPPPEGERWSTLAARVGAALDAIPPHPTLVVTHAGAMRAALSQLCGFQQAQLWGFDLPYGALLSLRIWPGEQRMAQITSLTP
jgi:alpha-ribazole phosphatase